MRIKKSANIVALCLIFTSTLQASDICDNAVTTLDINECGKLMHQEADKKLTLAYKRALKRINEIEDIQQKKDTKDALIKAERLWIQFRDKDCDAVFNLWRAGTIRGAIYWGCMIHHTEERTKDLELIADKD